MADVAGCVVTKWSNVAWVTFLVLTICTNQHMEFGKIILAVLKEAAGVSSTSKHPVGCVRVDSMREIES
jgi:hypothetical protein